MYTTSQETMYYWHERICCIRLLNTPKNALDAVAAYTQTFNKMGFIETEERDEIYMALRGILDALPGDALQKDALLEQFEQLRDF